MNDPLDEMLDARFRDDMPYIDDGGFTGRVLHNLPTNPHLLHRQRAAIILAAAIISAIVAYFASGEGWFVRESIVRAAALSPVVQLAICCVIGLLLMTAGLCAALSRVRDPLR